nr:SUMF1/EgtB/PvdO family nonheme iron enzyme [Schlegelella koreensis]
MLSLALMDARNHTLRWLAAFESALGPERLGTPVVDDPEQRSPLWLAGHVGWFQEYWIARNAQRARGERADGALPRLPSVLGGADQLYERANAPAPADLPDAQATRQYLAATLETTLDLLDGSPETDAALYFYRVALFHEDLQFEAFATLAQTIGVDTKLVATAPTTAPRPPLLYPAARWRVGSAASGFVFDNEKPPHEVAIPEFEIDAQPVTWAEYGEFVEDGGYDEAAHWSAQGRDWLERSGRRTPRHVDQMRHGVLQRRFGQLVRVPPNQPVVHVNAFEAEAWCRWAGRRLPTEVEWEAAARQGASRGFAFGAVWEWTASTFRPYPGFVVAPYRGGAPAGFGRTRVLRGASFATRRRLLSPTFRNFQAPERDDGFFGFRSCAL